MPNSKCTFTGAPARLRVPFRRAVVPLTWLANCVRTSSTWYACASSFFGDEPARSRKNGVPTVPAGGVCPSAVNGSDVFDDEIGERPPVCSGVTLSTLKVVRSAKWPTTVLSFECQVT